MSVYFVKGKGWRYDFFLKKKRYADQWFKIKRDAVAAEGEMRTALLSPCVIQETVGMQVSTIFLDMVNSRLEYLRDYKTEKYYNDVLCRTKKWIRLWGDMYCNEVSEEMINTYLRRRKKVSANTANAEIRSLRAAFNHGKKKKMLSLKPMDGIEFFPTEKKIKYVPSLTDINKVISAAKPEEQNYLWVIRETMGRVSEINRLLWDDVNHKTRTVILYTRKKKGGHLTPRAIPMNNKLYNVLYKMYQHRDINKPWVFWHRYWSKTEERFKVGPYADRKRLMSSLCKKAEVRYFRYHALRHSGASTMDSANIPIGSIQRILGHENRSTTEIYLHSIGENEREAMLKFEAIREKSHTESHTE